jgi:glycosyltransferase involved in cell wall biosynthesis
MRVLHIDTETGWRGGQQQVLLLARGLASHPRFRGEAITLCRPGSELARRLVAAGLPRAELDVGSPWSPLAVWRLRRLADELGVDILHAHASHAHTLAALAAFGTQRHLVATRRVDFAPKGAWKYRRCARVVAISQAIAAILRAAGTAPERLAVIPSGIDPARFAAADRARGRSALGLGADDLVVLCVAALEDHKDHATLLAAWSRLAEAHPRAHLILAGDGALHGTLAAQAASLPRVRLLGFREDIPDLLAAADAFALTSHLEGLGTAVMDAMCCALPVVATRAGGIPELIEDGVDGLLAPVRDAAAVAERLGRVLSDGGLRARLGAAARATAGRRFLADAMVDGYVDLYDRVLRGA